MGLIPCRHMFHLWASDHTQQRETRTARFSRYTLREYFPRESGPRITLHPWTQSRHGRKKSEPEDDRADVQVPNAAHGTLVETSSSSFNSKTKQERRKSRAQMHTVRKSHPHLARRITLTGGGVSSPSSSVSPSSSEAAWALPLTRIDSRSAAAASRLSISCRHKSYSQQMTTVRV